jgi:peptide/nickel transport system substrate-binding protein
MSLSRRTRSVVSLAFAAALVATAAAVTGSGAAHAANGSGSGGNVDRNADLTFAYAAGPLGFDPLRGTPILLPYLGAVYDRLTQINDDLEVEPMLAESWQFSADGDTLEFKLRDDATFTDGTKIDAAAVKANIDRARSAPYSSQLTALRSVTNVEAVNPTTVRLTITPGQGVQLPSVFAGAAGMIVNPKAIADPNTADLTQGPGEGNESGPYRLESTTLGLGAGEAQFVQRDDWNKYWDKTAGRIKRLRIIGIITGAQRINAVRAGDINMGQVTGIDVPQAKQLVDSGELDGKLYSQVTTLQALAMKATRPPLDNPDLRKAIKAAIDQQAMSQGLYSGLCEVSNQDYPSQHWAHVAALDSKKPYNVARARKLLADSGVSNPNLTLVYAGIYQAQAQVAKDMLGEIGINVELVPAPTQPGGPSFANGAFDMQWSHLVSVDPGDTMNNTYLNDTAPLVPLIPPSDQAEFDPLVEQLNNPRATQAERRKVWAQISRKLDQNAYVVPVCNASQVWLHDGSIANIDDLLQEWSGLVDFRYLYKTKT